MLSLGRNKGLAALALALFLLLALAACGAAAAPERLDLTLRVADGAMTPDTVTARQGDIITARLESDRAGAIHLHGYDLERELTAGGTAELQFTATATGRFPITFHETAAAGGSGHSHEHSAAGGAGAREHGPRESAVPVSLGLDTAVDAAGGLHVRIRAENWRWAPEEVDQEYRPGVGHAHIYANGEKLSRVYGPEHYVAGLPPGQYEIKVDLNDNAHNALTVNGRPLAVVTDITIPAAAAAAAAAAEPEPIAAAGPMALALTAHPDAGGGYNLQVAAEGFAFGGGQGYGLLSIDGTAITRLYADWLQLPALDPGMHTVSVALVNGAGRPYHRDGQPVAATIKVGGEMAAAGMDGGTAGMDGGMAGMAAGEHKAETAAAGGQEPEPGQAAAAGESGELELGFLVVEPR